MSHVEELTPTCFFLKRERGPRTDPSFKRRIWMFQTEEHPELARTSADITSTLQEEPGQMMLRSRHCERAPRTRNQIDFNPVKDNVTENNRRIETNLGDFHRLIAATVGHHGDLRSYDVMCM